MRTRLGPRMMLLFLEPGTWIMVPIQACIQRLKAYQKCMEAAGCWTPISYVSDYHAQGNLWQSLAISSELCTGRTAASTWVVAYIIRRSQTYRTLCEINPSIRKRRE